MILCMNCGKQDYYIKKLNITMDVSYTESGNCIGEKKHNERLENVPRCPKCHREVKLFKDVEE